MKKFLSKFFLRGLVAASFGPPVLAVIYWILDAMGAVENLSPSEVALGILSIELLALVVGGMSTIYQQASGEDQRGKKLGGQAEFQQHGHEDRRQDGLGQGVADGDGGLAVAAFAALDQPAYKGVW